MACFRSYVWLPVWVVIWVSSPGIAEPTGTSAESPSQNLSVKTLNERSLPPDLYDIWAAQTEKIYFTGPWKLLKLEGTRPNPPDDAGTRAGFWKEDFDDSNWGGTLVPWDINLPYPPPSHRRDRPAYGFSGVFWYRKTVEIPKIPERSRAILFFGAVDEEATVYLNGKRVGFHRNTFLGPMARGENYQAFTLDVTDAVRIGRNTIAVRGFGLADRFANTKHGSTNERLGIWLPCWLEFVPEIYLEKVLLTPLVDQSVVLAKIRIRNATSRDQTIRLRATFSPYQSYRYQPKHNPTSLVVDLGDITLRPGLNELERSIDIPNPVLWWPDDPFLYQVTFEAAGGGLGDHPVVIGRERFGFRDFRADGTQFLLNGKSWFLPGIQPVEAHYVLVRPDYAVNFDNLLHKMFVEQRGANIAFLRPHSGHYPWPYQDIADETGMLLQAERMDAYELDSDGKPTAAYRAKMTESLEAYWNHPSVVCYSLGNETWDTPDWCPAEMLNASYDLFKSIDPYRPCGTSSGRRAWDKPTRCDYYDTHEYVGYYYGPVTSTAEVMERVRKKYCRRWKAVKPFLNGECAFFPWHRDPWLEQAFGAPRPRNLDRAKYASLAEQNILFQVMIRLNSVGLRNQLDYDATADALSALWHKRYLEQFRYAENCRGFNLHQSPYHYGGPQRGPVFEAFFSGLSPYWVGTAGTDRNFYIDQPLSLILLAVNDSRFDIKNACVELRLQNDRGQTVARITESLPNLRNGQRKTFAVQWAIPADVAPGTYDLYLRSTNTAGEEIHRNHYQLHLDRRQNLAQLLNSDCSVALYPGKRQPQAILHVLETLGIQAQVLKGFDGPWNFGLLILGPGAVDDEVEKTGSRLLEWIQNGGKLLCLEQPAVGLVPWLKSVQIAPAGLNGTGPILADIVAEDHPMFSRFQWHEMNLWNGHRGQICDNYILPLSNAVLAAGMYQRGSHQIGMVAAEYRIGKGLCLFSQFEATKRLDEDPIATRYLSRLFGYVLKGWDGRFARKPAAMVLFSPPAPEKTFTVDLSRFANTMRKSEGGALEPRKWVMNAANDLADLPSGRQSFAGTPFEVLPLDRPSCLVVGPKSANLPEAVTGIPLHKNIKQLFVLAAAAGATDQMVRDRKQVGILRIHFGPDGPVATEDVPLILGQNVTPFDNPRLLLSGVLGWTGFQVGDHRGPDCRIGLSVFAWKNPFPNIPIEFLSWIAADQGAPILVSVTGEKP